MGIIFKNTVYKKINVIIPNTNINVIYKVFMTS